MKNHILGFPRIGAKRELKLAIESYWKGKTDEQQLTTVAQELRQKHWQIQKDAGLSVVTTGDFSFYDIMLDTCFMLNAIPTRFANLDLNNIDTYFKLARGDQQNNIPAMEMTKWFNTNYHYIVPEIGADFEPKLSNRKVLDQTKEAISSGYNAKPVLIGPITFFSLSKSVDGYNNWEKLDKAVAVYEKVIKELSQSCSHIQIDEPILCGDLPTEGREAFINVYKKLNQAAGNAKIILATYFDNLDTNLDLALASECPILHLDLVRGGVNLDDILAKLPSTTTISAGVVEGRNIWKNDFSKSLSKLAQIKDAIGEDRIIIASSCSLLHAPVDLNSEIKLDGEIKNWLSFAVQKCDEVVILSDIFTGKDNRSTEFASNLQAIASRRNSPRVNNPVIKTACEQITDDMWHRKSPYQQRVVAQKWLNLPEFPTTTIGSFPQTADIRRTRLAFKKGEISVDAYNQFMKNEIKKVVDIQEKLDLDVLVHGEPERNDMVEYFGQQLSGFCFTEYGWVQSYGSRCVKPPVIFGDVSRPQPMTVDWSVYAQSLTKRPMKGMLTGPVTILCWSFVRDDLSRAEVCKQIALAIRDEVSDLEKAGIKVIQIDEAALSEGLPIKKSEHEEYLKWAVDSFRLATCNVEDTTQIHTHMCYSEFNAIIQAIADMDADVISIESSRSKMELLEAFRSFKYPNEIGPGVYDIHSPRIPSVEEQVGLLEKAQEFISKELLWVNPDCGLKTRDWPETLASLENMVEAAKIIRNK